MDTDRQYEVTKDDAMRALFGPDEKAIVFASAEDLLAHCRSNLASFKCPKHIVFVELPKTSTGKVQKFKLREMTKGV